MVSPMDWRQTHFDETGRPRAGRHDWPPDLALERIEAISQNARATWFALLGLLTFVMVTLLGVEDIDFFGYDRQTQLPLVGVSVPTDLFFYTAPVLTAAVYAYFHFYLMKLWDALGRAPARIGNDALGDRIHPWLVSDAALLLRAKEGAAPNRALRYISAITSSALTWGYGWFVLGYAWAISFPAHDLKMSALLCAVFAFSLWIGLTSLVFVWRRVRRRDFSERSHLVWRRWTWWAPAAAVVAFGMYFTVGKTFGAAEAAIWVSDAFSEEETEKQTKERHARAASHAPNWPELSRANLFEAHLTEKPADWLDRDTAERQARKAWCSRRNLDWAYCVKQPEDWQQARRASWCAKRKIEDCDGYFTEHEKDFQFEWLARREDYLSVLRKPDLTGRDLRGANLARAFLPDVDMEGARMEGANLRGARMEGADFSGASLKSADLAFWTCARTNARSADFTGAKNMTQEQVNSLYGDEETKLPAVGADGKPLERTFLEGLGGDGLEAMSPP